jgi:hypothetical protein
MQFEILGEVWEIETFATGSRLPDCAEFTGAAAGASVHWYEATGIGRKEFKIKHLL